MVRDGREAEAIEEFKKALQATANSIIRCGIFNNLGLIYCNRGQVNEAMDLFQSALRLMPQSADACANIGCVHMWGGRLVEAERWLARALRINPWHNAAQFSQAMSALLASDYRRGFDLYECRFRSKVGLTKLQTPWPEWDGRGPEPGKTKTVYVYGEQGSGDIFLMLRYARVIRRLGCKQAWVVHRSMRSLVATIPEIDVVVADNDPLPDFDCHIPAASLPRLFGTTIDSIPPAPYIPFSCNCKRMRPVRVGICWRGSAKQANDRFRSTSIKDWSPVLGVEGVRFVSLQLDGGDEALAYPEIEVGLPAKDWEETRDRIAGLDLVITVDTSIVHLCGAINFPCWVALHCRPYFVYPLGRDDCPWYPSARLFRQEKEFEWRPVFERIADALRNRVGP